MPPRFGRPIPPGARWCRPSGLFSNLSCAHRQPLVRTRPFTCLRSGQVDGPDQRGSPAWPRYAGRAGAPRFKARRAAPAFSRPGLARTRSISSRPPTAGQMGHFSRRAAVALGPRNRGHCSVILRRQFCLFCAGASLAFAMRPSSANLAWRRRFQTARFGATASASRPHRPQQTQRSRNGAIYHGRARG